MILDVKTEAIIYRYRVAPQITKYGEQQFVNRIALL